jgi:DNA polymerase III sliding clamp (beta) subunit (PCNA family)
MSAYGSCEAHVDKAGATTLPARRLFNIIRELPSNEIQVDVDGKMPPQSAAGRVSLKFSDCLRMNFRRCRNSKTRKS